jgi:chemotaxis protein CheX
VEGVWKMRVEYINPFVEAAFNVLQEVLGGEIKRGDLFLKSATQPVLGVATIVGLAGDVEGRVLFDMRRGTAIAIASAMNMEEMTELDALGKATITELANMITAQAVTKLHDLGFQFDLTPPALITGTNMEVNDTDVEALIVPVEVPQGKIEINVAIRERAA